MGWRIGASDIGRAGRDAPHHVVEPAVIVALELHDRGPPGRRARQPDRGLHHLGPRAVEAHLLGAGHQRVDEAGGLVLDLGLGGEEQPVLELPAHRVDHRRRIVAEDHRPHAEVVVDQPVAIDVEQVGALPALDDERRRRDAEAEIAVDPAGHERGSLGDAPGRCVECHRHDVLPGSLFTRVRRRCIRFRSAGRTGSL